jgi:hypothetical protein
VFVADRARLYFCRKSMYVHHQVSIYRSIHFAALPYASITLKPF